MAEMIVKRILRQHINLNYGCTLSLIKTETNYVLVDAYNDPTAPFVTKIRTSNYENIKAAIIAYENVKAAML
ncbi:hypothetical protein [Trueperella pyogenes]|uniref:hypothetical protein n=1 Tax=Trueperella pyogenes TaxID=1661 RepID=UPI00345DF014